MPDEKRSEKLTLSTLCTGELKTWRCFSEKPICLHYPRLTYANHPVKLEVNRFLRYWVETNSAFNPVTPTNNSSDHLFMESKHPVNLDNSMFMRCWAETFSTFTAPVTLKFDPLTEIPIGVIYSRIPFILWSLKCLGKRVLEPLLNWPLTPKIPKTVGIIHSISLIIQWSL